MRLGGMPALRMLAQIAIRFDEVSGARETIGSDLLAHALPLLRVPTHTHTSIVRVVPSRVRCLRVCPTRGLVCRRAADPTCLHVSFYPCGSLFGMLFFVFTPFAI